MNDAAGPDPDSPAREPMIRLRPELSRSTARGVCRPVTSLKRGLLRLLGQPLDDLAAQASVAVDASLDEARAARFVGEQGLAEARDAREWAQVAIAAEAGAREEAQGHVGTLLARIKAIEQSLAHLQQGLDRLHLAPRLARLERERRQDAPRPRGHRAAGRDRRVAIGSGASPSTISPSRRGSGARRSRSAPVRRSTWSSSRDAGESSTWAAVAASWCSCWSRAASPRTASR